MNIVFHTVMKIATGKQCCSLLYNILKGILAFYLRPTAPNGM